MFLSVKNALILECINRKITTKDNLVNKTLEEIVDFIIQSGHDIGVFLSHLSLLLKKNDFQPFFDIEHLIRKKKNISVIVFAEMDITHDRYNLLADKGSFLYDNIIMYPLYDRSDSKQFIKYYINLWNFHIPKELVEKIIDICGGYLWLIHQVLRNLRNNPAISLDQALSNSLVVKKTDVIWGKLTSEERNILRKIYFGTLLEKDTLTHEYLYLKSIRLIQENGKKCQLGIPVLSFSIEKENKLAAVSFRDDHIFVDTKDITLQLTKKERAFFSSLLFARKRVVSRDIVAKVIWGNLWEEKYSDWAIDRLVHRLRNRLKKLGIDEKLLKTVKKKGFVFG